MPLIRSVILAFLAAALSLPFVPMPVRAQSTTIYRCETTDGISLQSKPCPKGANQTKRRIERPMDAPPPTITEPTTSTTRAQPTLSVVPITTDSDFRGPNDPYRLWQCMRADGSTFESRDGVPGKQWVVKPENVDNGDAVAPAQIIAPAKEPIVRHVEASAIVENAPAVDLTPPPHGAAPGAWMADQCTRLEPQQACERYAARRDELRKQIYAAMPSERVKYAPEEQDLTKMLYAACGR